MFKFPMTHTISSKFSLSRLISYYNLMKKKKKIAQCKQITDMILPSLMPRIPMMKKCQKMRMKTIGKICLCLTLHYEDKMHKYGSSFQLLLLVVEQILNSTNENARKKQQKTIQRVHSFRFYSKLEASHYLYNLSQQ